MGGTGYVLRLLSALAAMAPALHAMEGPALPATHLKVVGGWDFLSQYRNFEEPFWTKTITEQSGGQITAEITAFNKLDLRGSEIIRLMRLGLIDFGTSVLAYGADDDAEVEGIDLAGLNPTIEEARNVADAYLPVLDAHFQYKQGIKVLTVWPYPAQVLYCKSRLNGLGDLKGRKVRVGTRAIGEFVEALGGISINIPFGDAYAKIKQGNIDCAVTGTLPGNAAKLYEVTQYLYPLPIGWSMAMQGVNMKTWSYLDPQVQSFLAKGIKDMSNAIWAATARETEDGINCNTGRDPCEKGTKGNMTLVPISAEDRRVLKDVLRNVVLRRWAQRCGAACVASWNKSIGKTVEMVAKP